MTAIHGRAPTADLEIRLHGRGGQGGVTCAKILAAVYARLGSSVQSFGDYAGERSGAPVRAYTRVSDRPIENRNKVYQPDHLLVLDPTLLGPDVVTGLADGGALVLNSSEPLSAFAGRFERYRLAVVDATAIARRHGIGTRSVVIVNTTIAGAFVRAVGLPLAALEEAYHHLGFATNLAAAEEAYLATELREPLVASAASPQARGDGLAASLPQVMPLVENLDGAPTGLATGNWRTQTPRYADHLAPCSAFCPAGNDVVGFLQALAQKGEEAAAAVLARSTPLAGVCGRVCPAPCMEGCNRRELDGAVNIRALERWIADRAPIAAAQAPTTEGARRVAIVGGGPAGLAAALELRRAGQRVTLFDAEAQLGGVLRTGIPTYRLPREVLDREIEALRRLGIEEQLGEALSADRIAALAVEHDALIVATGLQKLRGLDGEHAPLEGVEQGIRFLHRVNLEGRVALRGHVVVLGGGNTAMDCARSALRAGAEEVTVVYRRGRGEMPAIAEEVEQAEHEGVRFLFLRAPLGFEGEGRVRAVRLAEVELGLADESGRRRPVPSDRESLLPCDTVLLALGQSADLSRLPAGWELREGRFYQGGVALPAFAAGDLATGDGTVTHAIGDGRRAAGRAMRALGLDVAPFERPDRSKAVAASEIRFDHFARAEPSRELFTPAATRAQRWDEVSAGLGSAAEAQRCFSCGACTRCDTCLVYCPEGIIRRKGSDYEVDYSFCKGCGICVSECPRKAMEMST
jgi:2-oxoacid:acceptor oxidoreductase gamma subunit (pyruvate/2-ketoisovalerate family)/2-oxoacid:acceptor oxidoreductase delta subunit (pyruvate/2-ketoisovalerate family)